MNKVEWLTTAILGRVNLLVVTCKNTGKPDLGGLLPVASNYIPYLGPKPLFYEAGIWHKVTLYHTLQKYVLLIYPWLVQTYFYDILFIWKGDLKLQWLKVDGHTCTIFGFDININLGEG